MQSQFQKELLSLGASVVEGHRFSPHADLLIVGEHRRTEKLCCALAMGIWIVRPEYVRACVASGTIVSPQPFEWSSISAASQLSGSPWEVRPEEWRRKAGQRHFKGKWSVAIGRTEIASLIVSILQSGGGTLIDGHHRLICDEGDFDVLSVAKRSNLKLALRYQYVIDYFSASGFRDSKYPLAYVLHRAHQTLQKKRASGRRKEQTVPVQILEERSSAGACFCGGVSSSDIEGELQDTPLGRLHVECARWASRGFPDALLSLPANLIDSQGRVIRCWHFGNL